MKTKKKNEKKGTWVDGMNEHMMAYQYWKLKEIPKMKFCPCPIMYY